MKKMPANSMQYVKEQPVIRLEEGQELLVRVYPWYNGAATGKTICLSDLTIHGMAQDATATSVGSVAVVQQQTELQYDLQGRQTAGRRAGISIVKQADGTFKKIIR